MEYFLTIRLAQQTLGSIYPKDITEEDQAEGTLLQRFSALILSGAASSDEEAVAALYGPDKAANYSPYQKLKSKFKRYFPMACSLLPASDVAPTGRAATSFCLILHAHARLCLKAGLYQAAERILGSAWKVAEEGKVIISLYLISQSFTELYAAKLPHPEKFSFFKAAYEEYARLFVIERRCANNRYRLDAMAFERSRRLENRIATAAQLAAENREMAEGLYYPYIFFNNYSTQIQAAMLAGKHVEALDRCDEALLGLENCFNQVEAIRPFFLSSKSRILAKMRNYEAFIQNIEVAKQCIGKSIGKHIVLQSHVAIVCLGTDHFQEAAQALENIRLREVALYFSPENGDMMKFIFAYVHTLYRLGYIAEEAMPAHIRQFRMTKFFNDSPTYERNKQGYNVHFIVLQLFNYLINEDYNAFFDKAESIEKYRQRYLQNEDGHRNGLLLQMLVSAQLHNFEREATREANLERLAQLQQSNNLAEELDPLFYEFIPYERLWDLYLEALD